jgi:hypothetical protein
MKPNGFILRMKNKLHQRIFDVRPYATMFEKWTKNCLSK